MQQQPSDQTSQYQQQQQQEWIAYQQLQQQQQQQAPVPPPAGWTPQPVPPPTQPSQPYVVAPDTNTDGISSLWIGDLQQWMDEIYLVAMFAQFGEAVSAKVIRNKQTNFPEGYGFLEFNSHAAAERALQQYNGQVMPNSEQPFRLNWATYGAGERRPVEGPDYTIFLGDLAADVTDYMLQETFRQMYPSVKGVKVVTDRSTGRCKGYEFVRFGDESEQMRSITEMNGVLCSTRPMRIGLAATNKPVTGGQQFQKAATTYQNTQGSQGENDPNNTTIFVGGLDPGVTDEMLKQVFGQYGELVHVKIPVGKRCGFVQFANRTCVEQALSMLNGSQLGGQSTRLSWGRSPSNKQVQPEQAQWNGGGGYYGYAQGYEAYGCAPPPQDPSMYYGGYPGYGNYQQQTAAYQQQPQQA